eukprot:g2188.t1
MQVWKLGISSNHSFYRMKCVRCFYKTKVPIGRPGSQDSPLNSMFLTFLHQRDSQRTDTTGAKGEQQYPRLFLLMRTRSNIERRARKNSLHMAATIICFFSQNSVVC